MDDLNNRYQPGSENTARSNPIKSMNTAESGFNINIEYADNLPDA